MSYAQLKLQLDAIEREMKSLGLWSVESPPDDALASQVPFCFDTLFFHEWLQWVFIPKMNALLEAGGVPPQACDIAPLAEHSFLDLPQQTDRLLQLIEDFDAQTVEAFKPSGPPS